MIWQSTQRLFFLFAMPTLLLAGFLENSQQALAQVKAVDQPRSESASRKSRTVPRDTDKKETASKVGKKCLFIGHSFFIPVAKTFATQCKQCGIEEHNQDVVFAGGIKGSPGRLWKDKEKRKQIQKILDSGKVELLGMTYFSPDNSSIKDYQKWIDYALSRNPETAFFIGLPWGLNGPKASMATYATTNTIGHAVLYEGIVLKLRELYPKNRFYWANYGKVAVELKRAFEKDELPTVEKMVDRKGRSAIFRDAMGHAAPLTLEMASLVWLQVLYDFDPKRHQWKKRASGKLLELVERIADEETAFNRWKEKKQN